MEKRALSGLCSLADGKSLDSFLLPLSLLKSVGNLEEKGGRVTKYCISYGCWNEQLVTE